MAYKIPTVPTRTIIRAESPTADRNPSKLKSKGTDLGVKLVAGSFGAGGETQAQIKDLVVTGGQSKSAKIGLGLKTIDKVFGTKSSGLYKLIQGKDIFDLLDRKDEPKLLPASSVLKRHPLESRGQTDNVGAQEGVGRDTTNALQDSFYKSTSDATSTYSMITRMNRRLDPLFGINWQVTLPSFKNVGFGGVVIDEEDLRWYVEDVSVTPRNYAQETVFRRGTQVNYPGFIDTGSLSITFYEDVRMNAYNYIQQWHEQIRDPATGVYSLPSRYKFDLRIDCVDMNNKTGEPQVIGSFIARNCWPNTRQISQLQSASAEPVKLTVDFATDGIEFMPSSASYEAIQGEFKFPDPDSYTPYQEGRKKKSLLSFMLSKLGTRGAALGDKVDSGINKFNTFKGIGR